MLNAEQREWYNVAFGITLPNGIYEQENPPFCKRTVDEHGQYRGIIFNETDHPTEKIYKKLFKSVLFKLNKEDRAKDSTHPNYKSKGGSHPDSMLIQGGHVTLATDEESYNFDNGDENTYSRVVRPGQLPSVIDLDTTEIQTFNISQVPSNPNNGIDVIKRLLEYTDPSDNLNKRADYQVKITDQWASWLKTAFDGVKVYADTVDVDAGLLTANGSNTPNHTISVQYIEATSSNMPKFIIDANIAVDDNVALNSAESQNIIPSMNAVKTYVDTKLLQYYTKTEVDSLIAGLSSTITTLQASVSALEARVTTLETLIP